MITFQGRIEALCIGPENILGKERRDTVMFELDGVADDRHRGTIRDTWDAGDKQPPGIRRRNERLWSAVSLEELSQISSDMGLISTLTPDTLGANITFSGIPDLSRLPKGTTITLPSGAVLIVEEYNPPCRDMGESIAAQYQTEGGTAPSAAQFLKAAQLSRGVVGVVDVAGEANVADMVDVKLYEPPKILIHPALADA